MTTLLAYDGRSTSQRALDYAIDYSVRFEDPLYILTVVREDPDEDDEVRDYMEAARNKAGAAGCTVHTIVMEGKPDETVLDVADRYDCGTIVVGRSNRSSLDRLFLGSVSDYVVKNAKCTVILVSEQEDE